mgnify:CR=1 FL=1
MRCVKRVSGLDEAQPGDVSFLANPKYAKHVQSTRASAVIADQSLTSAPCAVIRSAHPYLTFAQAIAVLTPPALPGPGVSPLAAIAVLVALLARSRGARGARPRPRR